MKVLSYLKNVGMSNVLKDAYRRLKSNDIRVLIDLFEAYYF